MKVIEGAVVWKRVFLKIARFLRETMNIEIMKSIEYDLVFTICHFSMFFSFPGPGSIEIH